MAGTVADSEYRSFQDLSDMSLTLLSDARLFASVLIDGTDPIGGLPFNSDLSAAYLAGLQGTEIPGLRSM